MSYLQVNKFLQKKILFQDHFCLLLIHCLKRGKIFVHIEDPTSTFCNGRLNG